MLQKTDQFFGVYFTLLIERGGNVANIRFRLLHVENVVVVGTKTNCCIRATVTDAYYLDYHVIVPRDAVATNSDVVNDVHLEDIRKYFGEVTTLDELYRRMEKGLL